MNLQIPRPHWVLNQYSAILDVLFTILGVVILDILICVTTELFSY